MHLEKRWSLSDSVAKFCEKHNAQNVTTPIFTKYTYTCYKACHCTELFIPSEIIDWFSLPGAFLEKLSGGSSSRAEGPHPLYIAHAHIIPLMLRIICAVNLEYYHQVEFQSFSLYILSKNTAVKTPRALLMGAHAQHLSTRPRSFKALSLTRKSSCIFTLVITRL